MNAALHIHLDPVGGIAGDMFVAALLDARPDLADGVISAVRAAGLGGEVRIEHRPHRDDVLIGSRFLVTCPEPERAHAEGHAHVHWRSLRERLAAAPLDPPVAARAIAIFGLLAEAEAGVHGVAVDDATFHEVGAWDSIADIVAAAYLVETIGAESWSVGSLPLGGGRVRCAHGELPVPAPATLRLLEGFAFHDDGRTGERVTPTGAAILKALATSTGPGSGKLQKTGHGFGLRKLDGMSNVLRAVIFEMVPEAHAALAAGRRSDEVAVLAFEIDDQTPEDLAIGLDRLRAQDGVLDLVQTPVSVKKGRLATSLRLLARPEAIDQVIDACFAETTTLGVRFHVERRAVLAREAVTSDDGIDVKLAKRPGGRITAKAESDDLVGIVGHAPRENIRRSAETDALARRDIEEDED